MNFPEPSEDEVCDAGLLQPRVRRAVWGQDQEVLRAIRRCVFVEEQGVPEEDEWDGQDLAAAHLIAETGAGIALGTTRVLSSGQIGRMAVLPDCRCRGVGRELLRAAVTLISEEAWPVPFLNAQTSAIGFYQKAGFIAEGPEFLDAGIPHRRMVLAVSAARVE